MAQTIEYAVEAKGLIKKFDAFYAVDEIDLKIEKGTVYGFLGPNGAGKTTTVRMLSTLLKIDEGTASIFGHDVTGESKKIRPRIAMTGQYASIDEDLTGMENLVMVSRLVGFSRKDARKRASELLKAFGLSDAAGKQSKDYSGGMRRRLDIAASIVVTPDLLFLDEPTTGLDPRSRNQVWDVIRTLTKAGTTVLLTTQYLDEADQLADRIAVINKGKIIAEGTSTELKASVGTGMLHVTLKNEYDYDRSRVILEDSIGSVLQESTKKSQLLVKVTDPAVAAKALNELTAAEIELITFSLSQPSLDEVFLALTDEE
ncbi:ATP-binding cassette domain-containing protein [Alkalibacterium olivapovliticus]|uniref:ABC-2 type transport system ATP-binding protein n=1 Tax=Alkalibacterium olivapovliticus TaxID=99907 RepID=A0A2T0W9X9_9LACT|nr:ATP-binding cassette domain-containing protein [Alkalibacterium olivapovliticus]PRY83503.1 ABC-2 type transport system ATP-binding protein [Alkalibacterium olivapovliticus]